MRRVRKASQSGFDIDAVRTILASLAGAALVAVAAQVHLQIAGSPIPVTGQTLALALLAALAGPRITLGAVGFYVGAATLGAGVLSGGRGGWSAVAGPSAGYLLGFAAAAVVIPALLRRWGRRRWVTVWIAIEAGSACILGLGAVGLVARGLTPTKALTVGVVPFVPGDIVKSTLAATIVWLWARRGSGRGFGSGK